MYRVNEIELRMKILCDVEVEGKMLDVYTECLDGAGEKQSTNKWIISKATEIDFRVPIFNELWRPERPQFQQKLKNSVVVSLPRKNLNKGALLIDLFELYIHDCENDISGDLAIYRASA